MTAPASASEGWIVVTGGNRGLGREVCRQLAAAGQRVLLTARDGRQAHEAATALQGNIRQGGALQAAALDVADPERIAAFAAGLPAGASLRGLVNNGAVSLQGFDADVVRRTLAVNYHGAAALTEALQPHLAPGATVVMVSSGLGALSCLAPPLRTRFTAPDLRRADVDDLLAEFTAAVVGGTERRAGWPRSAYAVSKVALNALTRLLAAAWGPGGPRVNAVCPGWVRTDMGGRAAPRSVAKGARGIVWAATLPADGPTGGFYRDGRAIAW